jgi:sulfur relay protein TusB/DsrH
MDILYTLNKNPEMQQLQLFTDYGGKILLSENAVNWLISPYAELFIKHVFNLESYKLYAIHDDITARDINYDQIWQEINIDINLINYADFVDLVANSNKIINI